MRFSGQQHSRKQIALSPALKKIFIIIQDEEQESQWRELGRSLKAEERRSRMKEQN